VHHVGILYDLRTKLHGVTWHDTVTCAGWVAFQHKVCIFSYTFVSQINSRWTQWWA